MAEPRIVAILRAHRGWMRAGELIDRYCEQGATLATARNALSFAHERGWLKRAGTHGDYRYAIADNAPRQILDGRGHREQHNRRDIAPAVAYAGPAFDYEPLTASLGLVCDLEVMPPEVGRIIDSLHQHFDAVFMGVE